MHSRNASNDVSDDDDGQYSGRTQDIEMGVRQDSYDFATRFMGRVTEIQSRMRRFQANFPIIERLHGRVLSAISESDAKTFRRDLDSSTDDCNRLAQRLRFDLKGLEADMEQLPKGSTDLHLATTQHLNLARKFKQALLEYHDIQLRYRDKQKQRFERQYRIVNPGASEQEISQVLDENYSGPIFAEKILSSNMLDDAQRVMTEVRSRHTEIANLSSAIIEVEKMFNDLSALISQQDDLVNQVSYQVDSMQGMLFLEDRL